MTEAELVRLVPGFDGWIVGDDPATEKVFTAGRAGKLRAAVKWGVGTDNVDMQAARRLGIAVTNTPGMFGADVADVAMGYVIGLARQTFGIDREVRRGGWPKPGGVSLRGKRVGLVGFGDIGRHTAIRLLAAGMQVLVYDPAPPPAGVQPAVERADWPARVGECDFLVFTCSLNAANVHMLNDHVLRQCRRGVRIVNVARGRLIDEPALIEGLRSGIVHSAALDVMEEEPLPQASPLREFEHCVFGSHNASNTIESVRDASLKAIDELFRLLGR
jgi:D-3-phosphoglycerate dehydrogenase